MAPKKKTNETAAAPAPPPVIPPEVNETTPDNDRFTTVLDKLHAFANDLKGVISEVKALQKEHAKLMKQSNKRTKKATNGGSRTLSGFAKPSQLSDQLCDFMGVTKGTSMARTEVTRMINEYIKKNNLQDANDKRHIIPDAKLKQILNLGNDDKLTYFNLQKYMKHHFNKETA